MAAMVDDIFVGSEDQVRQPVVAYELPDVLERAQLRDFSGKGSRVMLSGTVISAERCHPA
jgi:hypothetical protein